MSHRNLLAVAAVAVVLGLLTACGAGTRDDSAVGDPSDFVFDDTVIRTYELAVDEADWEWLNDNVLLEEYVPATLLFEGREYQEVAVRYKGFFGALRFCFDPQGNRLCKKLSLKLKFSEYNEIGRFYDLKRLNFHAMQRDPAMVREALGYGLYREAGVAAPRVAYANLVVNGEPLGLFALVEQIDGMFTRSRFPDGGEGNLYKEIWPIHFVPDPYLWALRTNREEDPNVDKMIRFARALDEATDDTFLSVLESWTDVDTLMSYLAVDRLIDNMDGIVAWYCLEGDMLRIGKLLDIVPPDFAGPCFNHNYLWYEDTGRDRVWLIPWDLDNAFQVPSMLREIFGIPDWDVIPESCDSVPVFAGLRGRAPRCDDLIRRLSSLTWDLYAERTQELLDGPFQVTVLHDRIEELADLIADAVGEDPNGPTVEEWEAAVQKLKDDVVTIRSYIEEKVGRVKAPDSPGTPAAPTATSAATTTVAPAARATRPPGTPKPPLSEEEARDKLTRATVLIGDLGLGYVALSDKYVDNNEEAAEQPDPSETLRFLDGAGRVLGRTVSYITEDITETVLAGRSIIFLANVHAFREETGAAQYYAMVAQMMGQGGGVEGEFAEMFVDPANVRVSPVPILAAGDEAKAFAFSGQTEAEGQLYPLNALLAIVRRGQVTAFVGSVRVGVPPDVEEVEELVRLLVERVDQEF